MEVDGNTDREQCLDGVGWSVGWLAKPVIRGRGFNFQYLNILTPSFTTKKLHKETSVDLW